MAATMKVIMPTADGGGRAYTSWLPMKRCPLFATRFMSGSDKDSLKGFGSLNGHVILGDLMRHRRRVSQSRVRTSKSYGNSRRPHSGYEGLW